VASCYSTRRRSYGLARNRSVRIWLGKTR
jgi:hypothetical protein